MFGASDEILGSIESGVDIENRIAEVYQTCRSTEEIKEAFENIRTDLERQIEENLKETKQKIFENLDEDVANLLRMHQGETKGSLDQREKHLFNLAYSELKEQAHFDHTSFSFTLNTSSNGPQKYFMCWRTAEEKNGIFFRDNHPLAEQLIENATCRELEPANIIFDYSNYQGKISALTDFLGEKGWLEVDKLTIDTLEEEEFLILSAKKDDGTPVAPDVAHKFFSLSASMSPYSHQAPFEDLKRQKEEAIKKHLEEVESRAELFYDIRVEQIESWSEDLKLSLEKEIKDLDKEINTTRKLSKKADNMSEKLRLQKTIRSLEKKRSTKRKKQFEEQDRIDQERDELIEKLEAELTPKHKTTPIFTIRWEIQ